MKAELSCILCSGNKITEYFYKRKHDHRYYRCLDCSMIFLDTKKYLKNEAEKLHYETHNNDVTDSRYQEFVSPIVNAVKDDFSTQTEGLDFGCGTGPVITYMLEKDGYKMNLYDPYFKKDPEALKKQYDFIVVCEVIEHFYDPMKEFQNLQKMLKPGGRLYLMTGMVDLLKDFASWHYHRDPTHVCFYSNKSFEYICSRLDLKIAFCDKKKLTILEKTD